MNKNISKSIGKNNSAVKQRNFRDTIINQSKYTTIKELIDDMKCIKCHKITQFQMTVDKQGEWNC